MYPLLKGGDSEVDVNPFTYRTQNNENSFNSVNDDDINHSDTVDTRKNETRDLHPMYVSRKRPRRKAAIAGEVQRKIQS